MKEIGKTMGYNERNVNESVKMTPISSKTCTLSGGENITKEIALMKRSYKQSFF